MKQPNTEHSDRVAVATQRPPFECIALLLQGGGALGAYQAGVYEALSQTGIEPDWVAGISIGAVNAALIAGNEPAARVKNLRLFWEGVTRSHYLDWSRWPATAAAGNVAREWMNQINAGFALFGGAPGFFAPRIPSLTDPSGWMATTSLYDTSALKTTLERLIDFDRINAKQMRFSVGAVNVRTGNFVYFDTKTHRIGPEHILASGALPPGFPAVEIEGEFYWDGGLVSNTPLQWVVDSHPQRDTLAFQVDLWSARGNVPKTLAEVSTRQKEIQYSSRTRANTDAFKHLQRLRGATADLLDKLPDNLKESPEARLLRPVAGHNVYNIVHLIYRARSYEGQTKDYDFSRASMEEHWRAGFHDALRTLRHPEVTARPTGNEGVFTFDLERDGRE